MKLIIVVLALFGTLLLILAMWALFRTPEDSLLNMNVPLDGDLTREGRMVCLPHRDQSGPQTLECAYGLLGTDGNYYGLTDVDNSAGVNAVTSIPIDTLVEVRGLFTGGEDDVYATVGTIEIDSIQSQGATSSDETPTISDGTLTFIYPDDFALATTQDQVLVTSVIPPCEEGFQYCFYYNGTAYENTNFESAGVGVYARGENTEGTCLLTQPDGYTDLDVATTSENSYAMSIFAPLEDSATGHSSEGEEYRLYTNDSCYAFVTRVGQSQIANLPTSTTAFTQGEKDSLLDTLRGLVDNIRLTANDEKIAIPTL